MNIFEPMEPSIDLINRVCGECEEFDHGNWCSLECHNCKRLHKAMVREENRKDEEEW